MKKDQEEELYKESPQINCLFECHPQAIYTSRLLDFKDLPNPQNSQEINNQF